MSAFIAQQAPVSIAGLAESSLTLNRNPDRGNATPGKLGSDFFVLAHIHHIRVEVLNPEPGSWPRSTIVSTVRRRGQSRRSAVF
jgi:hypothetical protein